MTDPATIISVITACAAVLFGFGSRNLATAFVSGIFLGLVQVVLFVLIAAKSGTVAIAELPHLKDAADAFMGAFKLGFANDRFTVYLAVTFFAVLIFMVAAYLVSVACCRIVKWATPNGAVAQE